MGAAFALGSQLRRYCTDSAVIVAIVIFALCSPVGIVVGSFLLKAVSGFGVGLVLSVASGTFFIRGHPRNVGAGVGRRWCRQESGHGGFGRDRWIRGYVNAGSLDVKNAN